MFIIGVWVSGWSMQMMSESDWVSVAGGAGGAGRPNGMGLGGAGGFCQGRLNLLIII